MNGAFAAFKAAKAPFVRSGTGAQVGTEDQGCVKHLARVREVDGAPVISRVAGERFS